MRLTPAQLEAGYWRAYKDFYRWGSIVRGAAAKNTWSGRLRHFAYAAGWKKFEPLWDFVIRARQIARMLPLLETILTEFGARHAGKGNTAPLVHEMVRVGMGLKVREEQMQ